MPALGCTLNYRVYQLIWNTVLTLAVFLHLIQRLDEDYPFRPSSLISRLLHLVQRTVYQMTSLRAFVSTSKSWHSVCCRDHL